MSPDVISDFVSRFEIELLSTASLPLAPPPLPPPHALASRPLRLQLLLLCPLASEESCLHLCLTFSRWPVQIDEVEENSEYPCLILALPTPRTSDDLLSDVAPVDCPPPDIFGWSHQDQIKKWQKVVVDRCGMLPEEASLRALLHYPSLGNAEGNAVWISLWVLKSLLMLLIPNESDNDGHTTLHIAASRGDKQCVKLLLDYGANPNATGILS
uniref:Uncharacterized protein n=1 Tax=Zea mays TaxID=4577 RepID=A0A804NF84_MAIZE